MKYYLFVLFLMAAIVADAQTCGATTQAGTACSRKVATTGAKCWQHGGTTKAQAAGTTSTTTYSTCGAPTKAGGKCKNRVKSGSKCHLHK